MLSVKEAAEYLDISPVYVTQIAEADERRPGDTGGTGRLYYKESTIKKLKKKREQQQKRNIKKRIANELKAGRPSEAHLTLTEASQYLGVAKGIITHNVKCTFRMKDNKSYRFYLPEDLLRMPADAKPRPKGEAGRSSQKQCPECGVIFTAPSGVTLCLECRGFVDPDDEWGVKVRPRKRSKPCPFCGGVLFFGQTACFECRKLLPRGEAAADGFECHAVQF